MEEKKRKIQTLKQKIKRAQKRKDPKTESEAQKELNKLLPSQEKTWQNDPVEFLVTQKILLEAIQPDNDEYTIKDWQKVGNMEEKINNNDCNFNHSGTCGNPRGYFMEQCVNHECIFKVTRLIIAAIEQEKGEGNV